MATERSPATAAATTALALACLWPFLWVLPLGAMSRDASIWMARSRLARGGDALEWLFLTQHFKVGYRPVTGLSYALNDLVGGYRLTDLALHALCVGLVYLLTRRLAPGRSPWAAVAGAALLALHPVAELVVPHLARRGYPLATALSLSGLVLLTLPGRVRLVGPLLLGAAALANDASYVVLVVGGLLAFTRGRDRQALAAVGAVLAALLVERFAVIGGIGGYRVDDRAARVLPILTATWDRLLGFTGPLTLPLTLPASVAALAGLCGFGAAALAPASPAADDDRHAAPLMFAWLLGFTVLFAPQGVWFPRQTYLLVAPLAVLVGLLLGQVDRSRPATLLRALPAVVVLLACTLRSPVLHGTDPVQREAWTRTEAMVQAAAADLASVGPRQTVHLVVPFYKRPGQAGFRARDGAGDDAGDDAEGDGKRDPLGARIVEQRLQLITGRGRSLTTAALLFTDPATSPPYATVTAQGPGFLLEAPPTTRASVYVGEVLSSDDAGTRARLDVTEGRLWVHDGLEGRLLAPGQ